MSVTQYQFYQLNNIPSNCALLTINTIQGATHLVITPPIEDPELSIHLIEWAKTLSTIITIEELKTEIKRYLTECNDIKYKYVIRDGLGRFEPTIVDPELKAYMDNFIMHDMHLVEHGDNLDNEIIEWVERVLDDYMDIRSKE